MAIVIPKTASTTPAAGSPSPRPASAAPSTNAAPKDSFQAAAPQSAAPVASFGSPQAGPPGAYYRKVLSSSTTVLAGISTTGVLPTPTFDSSRQTASGPLDIPDVYLGGTSAKGAEIDCGLSWDRVHDDSGNALFTDLSAGTDGGDPAHRFHQSGTNFVDGNGKTVPAGDPRLAKMKPDFAYHPYFRTAFAGQNSWQNRDPSDSHLTYLYPGQSFSMGLQVGQDGKSVLSIQSPDGTDFQGHFDAPGFADSARAFKRVISIDQEGQEGKPVAKTASTLTHGGWNTVTLDRVDGSTTPFTAAHGKVIGGTDTLAQYGSTFHVSQTNAQGGEWVDITPAKA